MIDIQLDCGWRIAGTTNRPRGLQVLDANGAVVKGIKSVDIHLDHTGFPEIRVSMYPQLEDGRATSDDCEIPLKTPGPHAMVCERGTVGCTKVHGVAA